VLLGNIKTGLVEWRSGDKVSTYQQEALSSNPSATKTIRNKTREHYLTSFEGNIYDI
jgi:hypothetical protein